MMKATFSILATVFVLGAAACEKSGKETQEQVDNAQATGQTEITNAQIKANEKIAAAESDFAKTREDYRHTMRSNLELLDKKLVDLDAKTMKATGTKKVELANKESSLRAQRDAFASDLRSIETASAATWDATKARIDKEWSSFDSMSMKLGL
jgi:hypothetical protein